jgi:hypothetical protein
MASKNVSLRLEAYDKLKSARRYPDESFSEVVLRATWPEETVSAGEFLRQCRERGALLSPEMLDRIERLKESDEPPGDNRKGR